MHRPSTTADPLTDVIANNEQATSLDSRGWPNAYVGWGAAHGDELGAVAAVPNDGVLKLIYELLESAVEAGWKAGAAKTAD